MSLKTKMMKKINTLSTIEMVELERMLITDPDNCIFDDDTPFYLFCVCQYSLGNNRFIAAEPIIFSDVESSVLYSIFILKTRIKSLEAALEKPENEHLKMIYTHGHNLYKPKTNKKRRLVWNR